MILEIINFSKRLSHTVFSNLFGIIIISLSAPLIAIYYDPLQMGEYSLFVSIVAILSYVSIGAIDQILLSNFSYSIDNNIKIFSAFAILNLTTTLIFCISLCVLNIFYNISDIYYFIPLAVFCSFYTDRGSHYSYTPEAGGKVDKHRLTQVGRSLKELCIKHTLAYIVLSYKVNRHLPMIS